MLAGDEDVLHNDPGMGKLHSELHPSSFGHRLPFALFQRPRVHIRR